MSSNSTQNTTTTTTAQLNSQQQQQVQQQQQQAGAVTSKTKVPVLVHPLASPGYVIIAQFVWSCVFNVCIFTLAYSFLIVVLPFALLYRGLRKCIVYVRLCSRGNQNAERGNSGEKFWLISNTTSRAQSYPSLILLLVVNGRLGQERVEYLVRTRLQNGTESRNDHTSSEQNGSVHDLDSRCAITRLQTRPELVCKDLVWTNSCSTSSRVESSSSRNDIRPKTTDHVRLSTENVLHDLVKRRQFTLERPCKDTEWSVELYTHEASSCTKDCCIRCQYDKDVVLLQFHHCYADIYTCVQVVSRYLLDQATFKFREDISPTQAICLGCVSLLAGPSILARNLFKKRDRTFTMTKDNASSDVKKTIYFSDSVDRSVVDVITTATGASVFDVLLSCLAGSLRTCLKQNGKVFPRDVNVCLQTNMQGSTSLKCFTSFNILSLPVSTEGAIPRLWEMRLRHNNISSLVQAITMSAIIQLAFLILPDVAARNLVQRLMSRSSCAVSCVLGQTYEEELLLDGRPVETFVPLENTGCGMNITITEYERRFQLAVLAPTTGEDWVIRPALLCEDFTRDVHELAARLAERARVVRARGQKLLNSRKNSVFTVEEEE